MKHWFFGVCLAAMALLDSGAAQAAGIKVGGPSALTEVTRLGKVIKEATHPVHIVFVHGISVSEVGSSQKFRESMCAQIPGLCPTGEQPARTRTFLPLDRRPDATIGGVVIWTTDAEWEASRPFVDRYEFKSAGRQPIIVDEVNWWPLVFPVKCRFLAVPEANLSGADKAHLTICSSGPTADNPYYPWITPAEAKRLIDSKPKSGGGVWANRSLKQGFMNWGLSDAVMALGPMRVYFRSAMDKAFEHASDRRASLDNQEFVIVAESLGSFIVMDAYDNPDARQPNVEAVLSRASQLYFFANQFALLELGRIHGVPSSPENLLDAKVDSLKPSNQPSSPPSSPAVAALSRWASSPRGTHLYGGNDRPKQIVSFSDPSDLLTYYVPHVDHVAVLNLYDQNAFGFFGLVENPLAAHIGHSKNHAVLKWMFSDQ